MDRGVQESLPGRRTLTTYKVKVGGSASVYLRVSQYEDGRVGELFITQSLLGSYARGMIDSFAIVCSKALQYGMPLEELCDSFIGYRFEPSGYAEGDPEIDEAVSILDYIFRLLKKDFLDGGSAESLAPAEPFPPTEPLAVQKSFI